MGERIFAIEYDPVSGEVGIRTTVALPDGNGSCEATERQVIAVRDFYEMDFPSLTFEQAQKLLSYREYARHCVDAIFKGKPPRLRKMFAVFIATYMTHDPEIGDFALRWNARNFESGASSPRVRGSRHFLDIESMCRNVFNEMIEKGFDPSKL